MKQHMMTHKLRDMPQHMFNSNSMQDGAGNNVSPDHAKDAAHTLSTTSSSSSSSSSIRVKTEAELSPRSADNSRSSLSNVDHHRAAERRERREFPSPADANYQLMLERQQHLQLQRHMGREPQSPPNAMHLQHLQSLSQPLALTQSQHIKSNEARNKSSSSLDSDEPSPKRALCKYKLYEYNFSILVAFNVIERRTIC